MKKKGFLLCVGILCVIAAVIGITLYFRHGGFSQGENLGKEESEESDAGNNQQGDAPQEKKDIYISWNGSVTEVEDTLDEKSISRVTNILNNIQESYLKGTTCNVYYAIIPDKNYYFPEEAKLAKLDYEKMYALMRENLPKMTEIDLRDKLTLGDYYKTDTHWRQESLAGVVSALLGEMTEELIADDEEYEKNLASSEYYGSFHPKSGLCEEPEALYYLSKSYLEACEVYDYQNEKEIAVYSFENVGADSNLYDGFLGGPLSLVTITNPNCTNGKELILFRDSFGSSIAPILAQNYEKITLVDIRYISSKLLDRWITFEDQDVLFLYNAAVLNNSITFK